MYHNFPWVTESEEYRLFLTAISMILMTLQRKLNIAYSSCLNYSYYSDFFFCLHAAFHKIDSFLVIICMTVHCHISSYKLPMVLMLKIVNWQILVT